MTKLTVDVDSSYAGVSIWYFWYCCTNGQRSYHVRTGVARVATNSLSLYMFSLQQSGERNGQQMKKNLDTEIRITCSAPKAWCSRDVAASCFFLLQPAFLSASDAMPLYDIMYRPFSSSFLRTSAQTTKLESGEIEKVLGTCWKGWRRFFRQMRAGDWNQYSNAGDILGLILVLQCLSLLVCFNLLALCWTSSSSFPNPLVVPMICRTINRKLPTGVFFSRKKCPVFRFWFDEWTCLIRLLELFQTSQATRPISNLGTEALVQMLNLEYWYNTADSKQYRTCMESIVSFYRKYWSRVSPWVCIQFQPFTYTDDEGVQQRRTAEKRRLYRRKTLQQ